MTNAELAFAASAAKPAVICSKSNSDVPVEERLIVALDVDDVQEAANVVRKLGDAVRFYKVGMQLAFAEGGFEFVKNELIGKNRKVFLDLKLFDIGETLRNAVRNIAKMGVSFATIHGNRPLITAAIEGRGNFDLKLFCVTVITQWDQSDLTEMGIDVDLDDLVLKRAQYMLASGLDGVIASGFEAEKIRQMAGERLKIITPGIRPDGTFVEGDDQKRAVTPKRAIESGADYIVVGRPILRAELPRQAARDVVHEIAEGWKQRIVT